MVALRIFLALGQGGRPGPPRVSWAEGEHHDDFICLGQPRGGLNETLYGKEQEGSPVLPVDGGGGPADTEVSAVAGGLKPAAAYLDGKRFSPGQPGLSLEVRIHAVAVALRRAGPRPFRLAESGVDPAITRTPLSMKWYDDPGIVAYDVRPATAQPVGWYRFTAPPGLKGMTIPARGPVRCWVDGRECEVKKVGDGPCLIDLGTPVRQKAAVALRIGQQRGFYGGSALPEPIELDCGIGAITPGDWSQGSALECYSGGAWYRRTIALTKQQAGQRALLELGDLVATAEVRVNGKTAGVLIAPPWSVDISEHLKAGPNRLEILVYNTLSNHYLTVPTRYRGSLRSGLIGPVRLKFSQKGP